MLNMYCPTSLHSPPRCLCQLPFSSLFHSFPSRATTLMHVPSHAMSLGLNPKSICLNITHLKCHMLLSKDTTRSEHAPLYGSLQPQKLPGTLTTSIAISQGGIPRRGKQRNKTGGPSHTNILSHYQGLVPNLSPFPISSDGVCSHLYSDLAQVFTFN